MKKLSLKQLKVSSFITSIHSEKQKTFQGGRTMLENCIFQETLNDIPQNIIRPILIEEICTIPKTENDGMQLTSTHTF